MTVTFSAGVNSTMQLAVTPAMRGRVMALYSVVFLGSTPIGAPLVGWLAEVAGPRAGMALGACAALAAAGPGERRLRARRRASGRQDGRRGVESRRVLVDLHAHYPMHLVPPEQADTQAAVTARRPGARWKAISSTCSRGG